MIGRDRARVKGLGVAGRFRSVARHRVVEAPDLGESHNPT